MSSPADKCTPNIRNVTEITDEAISKCEAQPDLRIAHIPPMERSRTELVDQEQCLSPISRLGFDVLSLVFELCSEDDWTAPLRIGVINRQWREVILATPRAWTFIKLDDSYGAKLTNFYFERSGGYLHHTRLDDQSDFDLFRTIPHRIQCLTINPIYLGGLSDLSFPNLTRLRLYGDVYLSQIAASKFPALLHLSASCIISDAFLVKLAFPPLQSLQLVVYSDTAWIELAQACKNSLLSVRLIISNGMGPGTYPDLYLPRLRALWFTSLFDTGWPMDIKTPELATYVQYHSLLRSCRHLLHKDSSTVASLCLHFVPSLSSFTRLHTFNLARGTSNAHLDIMVQLNAGDGICPLLRLLVLNMPGMSLVARRDAQEVMDEWSMRHRPGLVTRVTGPEHSLDLPEVPKASVCEGGASVVLYSHKSRQCGQSMPCV
jgi:hypothetical protein